MNNKGTIAITQIFLLVMGIIAITYIIGSSIEVVSAAGTIEGTPCESGQKTCEGFISMRCSFDTPHVWKTSIDCSFTNQFCSAGICIDEPDINLDPPGEEGGINLGEIALKTLGIAGSTAIGGMTTNYLRTGKFFNPGAGGAGAGAEIASTAADVAYEAAYEGALAEGLTTEAALAAGEATITGAGTEATVVSGIFAESTPVWASLVGIAISAAIAVSVGLAVRYAAQALGLSVQQAQSLGWTASAVTITTLFLSGAHIGQIPLGFFTGAGGLGSALGLSGFAAGLVAPGIGLLIGAIVFFATFKKESVQTVIFQCNMWDAKEGKEAKDNCELCNKQGILPCTEYQCKSLGKQCELINVGTDEAMCVYSSINDLEYPIIEPWEDILLENYKYTPDNSISPPDRGVYVQYMRASDKCVPAFTKVSFGITLNEPAKCKINPTRTNSFDEMGNLFLSGGRSLYNHSYTTSLPSASSLEAENITLENGGNYEIFVRCEDNEGNANLANFVLKFCVDDGPDLTTPTIMITNPLNQAPISYGTNSTEMYAYVDRPSDCKWSRLDQSYDNMENSMDCAQGVTEMNALQLYRCKTVLDGLKDNFENKFYFRCKSYPTLSESERIVMENSYEYTLFGTRPLLISEISPNDTIIEDASDIIKVNLEVKTSAGYNDGQAFCSYSGTGEDKDYNLFSETNSYEHFQELWLPEGDYEYKIRCIDLGGNADVKIINFHVESDTEAPEITRVYREGDDLKLITDEEAECRYGTSSNVGCDYNFEEGTLMISIDNDFEHYVDWESNTNFYIKCGEIREGGIYPLQNECSLIVRPFDIL